VSNPLKAFVGHSFLEADREVVSDILGMLDDVKKLLPGFEWDHAEGAEAKAISAKVFERLEGKNLFIGICTARERASGLSAFKAVPWYIPGKRVIVDGSDLSTKTSDWVIQEIGFALGRGIDVLLFVEEGVRPPGGLQGDLEFIPFSRAAPRDASSKLADMLSKLSPQPPIHAESVPPESNPERSLGDSFGTDYFEPNTEWNDADFSLRYQMAVYMNRTEDAARVEDAFRRSPYSKTEASAAEFEAMRITTNAVKYRNEWQGALEKLAKQYPNQPAPLRQLGYQYSSFGEYGIASKALCDAANLARDPIEKIELLRSAALALAQGDDEYGARTIAANIGLISNANPNAEAAAMAALATVWKELKFNELFIACSERCLELEPSREEPRFSLAHLYNELGRKTEALYHYRQLIKTHDNPGALNNLGVSAAGVRLPATAVDFYRKAERKGNSLATSNLVYAYLGAGFVDEALKLSQEGLKTESPHPSLSEAYAAALRMREEEEKKEQDASRDIPSKRSKWLDIALACTQPAITEIAPTWKNQSATLQASQRDSSLEIEGRFIRQPLGGLAGLMSYSPAPEEITLRIALKLVGLAGVGTIEERPTKPAASVGLFGDLHAPRPIACIFSADGKIITIYEDNKAPSTLNSVP
jgi:tetratricopeptide (TPR) repeat protein